MAPGRDSSLYEVAVTGFEPVLSAWALSHYQHMLRCTSLGMAETDCNFFKHSTERFVLSLGKTITQNHLQVISGGMLCIFAPASVVGTQQHGSAWLILGLSFDLVPASIR